MASASSLPRACRRARRLLDKELSGALPAAEEATLSQHLRSCPACQQEREALQSLAVALRRLGPRTPPVGLWEAIAPELEPRSVQPPVAPWWRQVFAPPTPLAAAAVAAAAFLLALLSISQTTIPRLEPHEIAALAPDADTAFYTEQHAIASWSEPLSDRLALGTTLVSAVAVQTSEDEP